jgi:chaperonin cofactor prefoldin
MKMKITEKYIDLFVDLADKTQSIIEKLDQDIAMLDSKQTNLRSKIEEFSQTLVDHDMLDERVMDLNQKIDRLRGQVTYLETENRYYESSIDSLTFKVYLSLIGLVILILFIAAKYLLDSSYKPSGKSSKHVHIQRQSSDKSAYHTTTHKNAKIRKSSSIDLECELRFLNNVTSHKRGKKKTLTRF